ncbi:MAG: hypothetical protein IJU41_07640, partial [Clostridia bacterium]|nr:hypothetical protein [Clostridia bacterium]
MQRNKIPRFYIALLVLVLLVVILTAIGKEMLTKVLYAYEAAQPQTVAQDLLDELAADRESSELYLAFEDDVSSYETYENKHDFLRARLFSEPLQLKSLSSALTSADVRYAICTAEGKKVAVLTLSPKAAAGRYGFIGYSLQAATLEPSLLQTVSVSVPGGYTLFLNGQAVDFFETSGEQTPDESVSFMPDGVRGVWRDTYAFSSFCAQPLIEVVSEDGEPSQIKEIATGVYSAALAEDTALADEYADHAIEATKAYAKYMQNDSGFGGVRPYFDPQSDIYQQLRTSETLWVIDHTGYSFSDAKASEFINYGDGVFSCRVSLTHTLTYPRLRDYHDYIDMTW